MDPIILASAGGLDIGSTVVGAFTSSGFLAGMGVVAATAVAASVALFGIRKGVGFLRSLIK